MNPQNIEYTRLYFNMIISDHFKKMTRNDQILKQYKFDIKYIYIYIYVFWTFTIIRYFKWEYK